ncbi:PEP-CTERM protein-sorting domain-containing protein [Prosthecobacter debontii]|uniref:PEP-CTERM protein-sorting domain-containing protein n=1 Tax=Prosthecobacter debontii TaxID=48467 RepID=A0A1T4XSB1_9BACT|nr:autotransporter-associated beta strand repeat-containing protein [Prosthecobacter debontii]SKA92450.1 PEP-CTERM protein-sorting domain-containing protein [Prosthecobacter debontii]
MMTSQSTSTSANHRPRRGRWLSRALATVAVMSLPVASAQTLWTPNLPGSYSWQTSTNWLPNVLPSSNGALAELLNPIAPGVQTVTLDGAVTLGGLTFSNTQGTNFFLAPGTGGTLAFNSGGLGNAAIVQTGSASNVISAPISLAENLKVQVDAGNLNLAGVISGTGFGLVKEGDGMLILSGANTFTGANTLNDGITLALVNNAFGGTAGGTTVSNGATLALGGINGNGITVTDTWTVGGSGYLGLGAIRGMYGVNTNALSGNVTFTGDTVIHNDVVGTLQFNGNIVMDQNVRFNTHGFISLNGVVTGSTDIVKYGLSGLRFANNTSANTYSGSITSILGEVRAEFVNAYQNVSRFTMRNSNLQLVFLNTANSTEGRLNDATPIDLYGGRIRLENSGFTGNPAFNFAETVGAVTLKGGGSMMDMRGNTTSTSVLLTLSSLTREAMGSTLYMEVNGTISGAAQLGTSTQSRILNLATVNHYNGTIGGWATTRLINGSGEFVKYGSNGYTALVAADYSTDSAQTTWTGGTLNVKLTSNGATLTGNRSINTMNIYTDTARTLDLGGFTLSVENGGIMFSRNSSGGPTHTISNGFITAGAGSTGTYELFLHTANANGIVSAVITDNGLNPVSVVKAGPNTVSLMANQAYTGSTYMNEGVLRDFIGYRSFDPSYSAIPSTNINVVGSIVGQSVLEYDRDFTRALGAGSNQIQFTGGTGSGFSAYGSPIKVNFGGSGAPVTWGSTYFNPSIFTLNGGNATHVVTMVNPLDLNGEVRYIRLDGGSSGGGRAAIGRFEGDLYNGGIVKRGGGTLVIDNAKTYSMGTTVSEGLLWVRGNGNLGTNVIGNDIGIGGAGALHIDSPANVGSNQRIVIHNSDNSNAAAIGFGPGYGDGSNIAFQSFNTGSAPLSSGGNNIFVTNSQSGQARRVAVQIYGMETAVDFPGLIRNVAPFAEVWFGATTANAIFTGATITPTGNTAVDTSRAFRLGSGGGTLTITNANVLTGAFPLIVGAPDQNARTNIGGVIYLPQAQNYSGQVTVGSGGALVVGQNGALSTTNNTINLRSGDLRLSLQTGTYFATDSQYAARNIDVAGGNATLRAESLGGSGQSLITLNTLRLDGNDRVLTTYSSTTRQNGFLFLGKTTLTNTSAGNSYIDVGFDNQGFNSGFIYLMGVVEQTGTGDRTLIKRNGGTLVLGEANTFKGGLQVQQGNLVLTHLSAGGVGTTITMAVNNDRTARLNFMKDGSGPFLYNYPLSFTGGNNGSNRIVTVAPETVSPTNVNQEIQVPSISWAAVASVTNFDLITDGAHGYRFTVNGDVALARDINFRTRGALTTVQGAITGAFNVLKAEQGTLWLNGNNTYNGTTTINNGYLVLGHNNALGTGTSAVTFGSTGTSQILLNGARTISRNITNSATAGVQTLGGLDGTDPKTFSGSITMTRGLNVSAMTGGDVNFTGVISAAGALNKVGTGTVVLNPTSGTGNTYTGGTTVTAGTLIGKAQTTSGNPFGTGAFTVANGTIQLDGRTGATSSAISTAGLTVSGGARVVVNDQASDAFSTTFGFSTLARSGAGTVTFVPQLGNLGTQELITFSTNPTLGNGIVGTWAVRTASGSNAAADYVTTTGSGPYSITTASYGGTGNLDLASGATQVFNAGATASLLTANRSVYAFRSDAAVDLATYKLSVGSSGQAGIILNNGASITGSTGSQLDFGNNQLNLYVDSAAVSSISVPLTNVRDNSTNTFSTNVDPAVNNAPVFVKFGRGVLQLNTAATFQGGITVNEGTLRAGAANVFPTFTNLNAVSGSIVTISPGATVDLNNFDQEFGNLSGGRAGAEFQFAGGVLNLGAAKLTVGRESPGTTATQTFSGQVVGGAGSRIIKVGSGRLVLDNISGNTPNSLDVLEINQGIVRTWLNDQSWATPTSFASSIPSTTTVLLRGGEWEAYAIGDSTGNQQIIQLGNNVIHQGGDSIIDASRPTGGGGNKLLTFGTLTLDVQRFLSTGANTYIPRFDGLTTLTNHARVQNDSQLVLAGGISDGGNYYTLTKIGASDLTIDKDNSATWSGGLVITQGTLYLGTRGADEIRAPGVTLTLNAQANAGTGDIILNQGFTTTTAIRMAAPSNVLTAQGQRLQTFGSETSGTVRIDLGTDAPLSSYGLRSTSNGSISLGLGDGGLYTSTLDQAAMGSGRWGISAFQGATFYMPSTLGVGFDNTYRFLGTNGGVLGLVSANVLTGDNSVVLGRSPLSVGNVPTNSIAQIRTYGNQNYTGNTTIHRGADYGSIGNILIFHGDYATPQFEVYGRLEARGDGRFTNDAGAQVNDVILRPGGALRLDYNMDVNDQFVIARLENSNLGFSTHENKWGDNEPMILDGAQFGIINSSGRVNSETIGEVTVKGGAGIFLERNGTNGQPILITNEGIVRDGQAVLALRNTTVAELGSSALQSQKFYINDPAWVAANMHNGMFDPWFFSATNLGYLSYNTDTGVVNMPYVTGTGASFLAGLTNTSVAHYSTAGNATLSGTVNSYALRVTGTTTLTGQQINLHSGGLITNGAVTIDSNLYFGNGTTPVEGIIYAADNTLTINGKVTAANLTRGGPSTVVLANTTNAITGNIQVNGGTLIANGPGTLGTASTITLHADYHNNNNGSQMPVLSLRTASTDETFNHEIVIAQNVPIARIDLNRFGSVALPSTRTITIPTLTVKGTDGAGGTLLQIESNTPNSNLFYNLTVNGETKLQGSSGIGIRVNTATTTFNGAVTSTAAITKTGNGVLRFNSASNSLTGDFILNRGEWFTVGDTATVGGTGNIISNFGVIRMANTSGTTGIRFSAPNQTVTVNGQTTFVNQRVGSTNAHISIGATNNTNGNIFTTNNSPWIIFQAASFGDQININSSVVINDAPWFRTDSAFTLFRNGSVVSGEGKLNKAGTYLLAFDNNAPNTYAGGTDVWAGELQVRQANGTLGQGAVRVFAGASLAVRGISSLGATGVTQIVTSNSAFPVIGLRGNDGAATFSDTFNSVINRIATTATIVGNGNGILAVSGGQTLAVDPDFYGRNGGIFANWWLGSQEGSGTVSANSLMPWGPMGDEYRLGGGHNGTVTMNPALAGSDQLSGTSRLVVGGGQNVMGYGGVAIGSNASNSFEGGTLVSRTRDLSGAFRGAPLILQGGQVGASSYRSMLGFGDVDVFGEIRMEGGSSTLRGAAGANLNNLIFHPGSRIRFDNGTVFAYAGSQGRWADSTGMTLNTAVLEMYGDDTNNEFNSETIGNLTIGGGSEVALRRRGSNWAELKVGDIIRSGDGTLMITTMVDSTNTANILGASGTASALRLIAANGSSLVDSQGMVEPWIFSRVDSQFLKYDSTNGFQLITQGGAPSNYKAITTTTLTPGTVVPANDGSEIVSLEGSATFTLGGNLDVHALRVQRDINTNAAAGYDSITIRSGGLMQVSSNSPTINANLYFGVNGTKEAFLSASNNTLQLNGKIYATKVVKSGTGFVNIRSEQSQFTGDWVVNGGGIQFLTPGAASTGQVFLNGSRMNDRDNTFNLTEVRYNFNPGTPDVFTWTGGKITATDYNRIYGISATDRTIQIPAIDLKTTNAVAGTGQEGAVVLRMDGLRSVMRTGAVTLYDHYLLNIETDRGGPGATTGVQLGSGTGVNGIYNQGLFDVRKIGIGMLILGDNSSSFINGRTFTIGEGGVRVMHNGAFGDASISAIINPTGALEIGVPNWTPTANLTQAWGSTERWAVNQARGSGNYTLPTGVHLQIMASQTGTRTIDLDGGSIMGYLPLDWEQVAVNHTLTSGITVNLLSDSYLGQLYPAGTSNGSNHFMYDMGKMNTTTNLNPNDPGLRGSYLHIDGNITGNFDLTKVGQDMIILSGAANSFRNTNIENGVLQIGRNNTLPVTTELTTRFSGMFDLNGYNQEVAALKGTGGSIHNGGFDYNTLTVNQSTNTVYGGQINGSTNLVKSNAGELTLSSANNAYVGDTKINAGRLVLTGSGAINESRWIQVGAGAGFDVSARTGGSYSFDGVISGGGVGALRADNTNRGSILGSLVVTDAIGLVGRKGTLAPGLSSTGGLSNAGDQIGHLYISQNLTLAAGTATDPVERLTLQLGGATTTLTDLGWNGEDYSTFILGLGTGTADQQGALNGTFGNLSGHDYVNVGGELNLNGDGTIRVSYSSNYAPQVGDVFNLLDWTTISNVGFSAGSAQRLGGGYESSDLYLPTLSPGLSWNTSLFANYGVLVVVPEPSRALLLMGALLALGFRRRRAK